MKCEGKRKLVAKIREAHETYGSEYVHYHALVLKWCGYISPSNITPGVEDIVAVYKTQYAPTCNIRKADLEENCKLDTLFFAALSVMQNSLHKKYTEERLGAVLLYFIMTKLKITMVAQKQPVRS